MADNNENNHQDLHQLQTESLAKLYKEELDMSRKIQEMVWLKKLNEKNLEMATKIQETVSKHVTQHIDLCRQDLEQQLMKRVETLKSKVRKDVKKRMETLKTQLNEEIMQEIQQGHGMNFLGRNEDGNCDGNGENFKGFGDPKQDGGGQSSCFKALSLVEIRAAIIKHLDVKSLKNVRLVSSSWNEQVTPLLAEKTTLDAKYLLTPRYFLMSTLATGGNIPEMFLESGVYEIPSVEPRLLKNVTIKNLYGKERERSLQVSNLVPFATKYHSYVEELFYKQLYGIDSAFQLFNILQDNDFPMLKKINMDLYAFSVTPEQLPMPLPLSLPKRNSLECIEIWFVDGSHPTAVNFLKDALQELISSARNLKSLTIIGNFFPHFSEGQRILEFAIFPELYRSGSDPELILSNILSMNKMLENVKYAQKLEIKWNRKSQLYQTDANSFLRFHPVMDELTELNFSYLCISDWGLIFSPERFPRLKKLTIVYLDEDAISEFNSASLFVMGSVKTLEMEIDNDEVDDQDDPAEISPITYLLTRMTTLLPNVTKLVLRYTGEHDFFQTALRVCCQGQGEWKIEKLELYFSSPISSWSHLLRCLQSLSMQTEVSSVKQLQLTWSYEDEKYLPHLSAAEFPRHADEVMNSLLLTKNFQSVIIVNMFPNWDKNYNPIRNRVCAFIKENELPITFRTIEHGLDNCYR